MSYIDLVNKLRDRFNEPHLTTGNWASVVGFDQFSKDAINYAYHDILNAEMEWPFLHQTGTLLTTPGTQFYTLTPSSPTGFTSPAEIKSIDWDKFYLSPNETVTTISSETHIVPVSSPHTISVNNSASWSADLGVIYTVGSVALSPVIGDPAIGQYTITPSNGPVGTYVFSASDAGKFVKISYTTTVAATAATIENAQYLQYIDYELWCQQYLQRDLDALSGSDFGLPQMVFKTQKQGQLGITPIPDKIYQINFEYWLDGLDMSATTDTPLFPSHFFQVIIDGAGKYAYEFREDPQMAQLADARFKAGITRMRIELINRDNTMKTGFNWVRGTGYASPFAGY